MKRFSRVATPWEQRCASADPVPSSAATPYRARPESIAAADASSIARRGLPVATGPKTTLRGKPNNRVMNRKVTERLVGMALTGSLESAGDFVRPLGATKSPMI